MTPCLLSDRPVRRDGYAQRSIDGKMKLVHRVAWEDAFGAIPDGLCVLHRCDVRNCINPEHLFLGTQKDNMRDCAAKDRLNNSQRRKTHCPQGHEYDRVIGLKRRIRRCGVCAAETWRRWYLRQSA